MKDDKFRMNKDEQEKYQIQKHKSIKVQDNSNIAAIEMSEFLHN